MYALVISDEDGFDTGTVETWLDTNNKYCTLARTAKLKNTREQGRHVAPPVFSALFRGTKGTY